MKLIFNDEKHEYRDENGVLVPSVTTILDMISAKSYAEISKEILEYAKQRGSAVHDICELMDYGMDLVDIPTMTPELHPFVRAYELFLRDYKPNWQYVEQVVSSEELKYCGRLDRAGLIGGKLAIADLKTNQNPTKENKISVCCQTIAYEYALTGKVGNAKRFAVYLKKDGDYKLFDCQEFEKKYNFDSFKLFNDCLALYNTLQGIKSTKSRGKTQCQMN